MTNNKNRLDEAFNTIQSIREESKDDEEYGFNNSWKTFMKKMMFLTPQSASIRIQNYIIKKSLFRKLPPSLDRGDATDGRRFYEIKVSVLTNTNDIMNVVQIRMWQKIDGYQIFAIDSLDNFTIYHFFLTKNEMKKEVERIGNNSHITKKSLMKNENIEMSIRIKPNSEHFNRWMDLYYVDSFPILIS